MKHFEDEINMFIDGELDEENIKELFTHLSTCSSCSNTYLDYLRIKKESQIYYHKNISTLKEGKSKENKFYKYAFYISAAATVLFFMLFVYKNSNRSFSNIQKQKVDTVYVQKINNFTNVESSGSTDVIQSNEINYETMSEKEYLDYIKSLRTVTFYKKEENKI